MIQETLQDIAQQIEVTGKPRLITVRELLATVGQERRGIHVCDGIRSQLRHLHLKCEPDFENIHFDSGVHLSLVSNPSTLPERENTEFSQKVENEAASPSDSTVPQVGVSEPAENGTVVYTPREVVITVRQGIPAAGRMPILIRKQEPIFRALSQMSERNETQLLVANSERGMVDGIFSWQSYGKAAVAGKNCTTVGDCLSRDFAEMREDKPLFDAVREVIRHGTAVIRAHSGVLCGLVSQRDVADVFIDLSEPFLFLGQIENHMRELVERMRLSCEEIKKLVDPRDASRADQATQVDELTLGELVRAFQEQSYWARLGLKHDRAMLLQRLDRVREIRNKVMHFDADQLSEDQKRYLTDTRRILQEL